TKWGAFAAAWVLLALAACASPSPRTEFYTLDTEAPAGRGATSAAPDQPAVKVSVWQVSVPEMVDRSELVLRTAPNRVQISDFHRWAEPLRFGIARVLADDLALRLGSGFMVVVGQPAGIQPDVRVSFDVQKFEAVPGEGVAVEALWNIRPARGEARSGRSMVSEREPSRDYAALVAAYSRALAQVAREVSVAVR
ncbi:MAG TPA: PqiC family protein, partial [Rudaea sp.]|nr:PqiC family protein [Rudaea sp.]